MRKNYESSFCLNRLLPDSRSIKTSFGGIHNCAASQRLSDPFRCNCAALERKGTSARRVARQSANM